MPSVILKPLRVAIIGGGPGGLGASIAFSALPDTEVTVYEQAHELREIGAGIRVGFNCWTVLGLLGADREVKGHKKTEVLHRNGLTGEVLKAKENKVLSLEDEHYLPQRVRRTNLQAALKARIPPNTIKFNKKLLSLEDNGAEVLLAFVDGTEVTADLVVGGDGIRSVVRQHVFPTHNIKFTGTTIFRTLIPQSLAATIPGMLPSTSWWHGPAGHVYSSPVDDPAVTSASEMRFEIAARSVVDPATATGKRFSWGVECTNERVEGFFTNYDPRVRALLASVPQGAWKEFSAFAGPRLSTLTGWEGKVVLIGDASHPLSGAFGSGAAFALEDGWVLARCVELAQNEGREVKEALGWFDRVRSPYYARMYDYLDQTKQDIDTNKRDHPNQSFQDSLQARIATFGGEDKLSWIYGNDIQAAWAQFVANRNVEAVET